MIKITMGKIKIKVERDPGDDVSVRIRGEEISVLAVPNASRLATAKHQRHEQPSPKLFEDDSCEGK